MNCQELARLFDERDLEYLPAGERALAEGHLAACADCARSQDLHRRLNALPIAPLGSERIAQWRAVALAGADVAVGRSRRARLVLVGTVVCFAAAAALLVTLLGAVQEPEPAASGHESIPGQWHVEQAAAASATGAASVQMQESRTPVSGPAAPPAAGSFTVYLLPLQIATDYPLAQAMGNEYYSKLLERLRAMPRLVLVDAAAPADFRLRVVSGYGKVPERFGGHEQWQLHLVAETRRGDSYTQVLGFSINPDCGRLSPVDLANDSSCTPAGMVQLGVQQLRRGVFPPDPDVAGDLQARFLDTSLPQDTRRQALADLIELRQRAPGAMDPELVHAVIDDAIANAPYSAQRVNLWRALRGQAADLLVQPLVQNLRREPDDAVRLEMVSMLAAQFATDPAARSELDMVARRDVKMLVRKVAERALAGSAPWRDYVVATVKDASLPTLQRFEPLAWMAETRALRPADGSTEADLLAVARRLLDEGEAAALADVLAQASNGPSRATSGILQIAMTSVQHPAVADLLIAIIDRQPDFAGFSLLGRHRADPRIEAKLKDIAATHPEQNVRQLAAAQLMPP